VLIQFSVENYLSYKQRNTLSMVASSDKTHLERNGFQQKNPAQPDLIKSAVIYGPNASGKSNLLEGLRFMKMFVLNSAMDVEGERQKKVRPFLLDKACVAQATEFEILFANPVGYRYGFALFEGRVMKEWLFSTPKNRESKWFTRSFNPESNTYDYYWNPDFRGEKRTYEATTRANSLLLSNAIQLNNKPLEPVYRWFSDTLRVVDFARGLMEGFSIKSLGNDKTRITNFLNAADLSINEIQVREKEITDDLFIKGAPEEVKRDLLGEKMQSVDLVHGVGNTSFRLPLEEDSHGTRRLFSLAGPILDVFDNNRVLVVDELHRSLHPLILRFLVDMFHQKGSGAQLIFTTHDPSILDQDVFRRDQVWFVEKDEGLASELFPLTDFHPRKSEAIGKGYLNGRYGALPFVDEAKINGK